MFDVRVLYVVVSGGVSRAGMVREFCLFAGAFGHSVCTIFMCREDANVE